MPADLTVEELPKFDYDDVVVPTYHPADYAWNRRLEGVKCHISAIHAYHHRGARECAWTYSYYVADVALDDMEHDDGKWISEVNLRKHVENESQKDYS